MTTFDEMRQERIDDLKNRYKKGVIEKANLEFLTKLIEQAENITEVDKIMEMGIIYRRTGLNFDKKLEKASDNIKYLQKNMDLSFNNGGGGHHSLIIGDNYDALLNLLITHRNKIDVVYIDPPYGCNDMGEFAETNYENAITRDNLLSMLYPRLMIAKNLMADKGIIFCSIDDKNHAYVKCLMDEIYGERNFIANACCVSNPGGDKHDYMESATSYVLIYAKDIKQCNDLGVWKNQDIEAYTLEDEYGKYKKGSQLEKWGNDATIHTHPSLAYSIYYNPDSGNVQCLYDYNHTKITNDRTLDIVYSKPNEELISSGYYCIRPRRPNPYDGGRWRMSEQTFKQRLEHNDFIFERLSDNEYKIYEKDRYKGEKFIKAKNFIPSDIAKQKSNDLVSIFGKKVFDYPKPVSLLKHLIGIFPNKDIIVLDFFAGSGTTGEAVLELNKKDGGKRTFILVTNNEDNIAYGITAERLKRVMTGEGYHGENNFSWLNEHEPYGDSLDVYDIKKISKRSGEPGNAPFDVIDEECYGLAHFDDIQDKIAWVCENFEGTCKSIKEGK